MVSGGFADGFIDAHFRFCVIGRVLRASTLGARGLVKIGEQAAKPRERGAKRREIKTSGHSSVKLISTRFANRISHQTGFKLGRGGGGGGR